MREIVPLSKNEIVYYTEMDAGRFYRLEEGRRGSQLMTTLNLMNCYSYSMGYEFHGCNLMDNMVRFLQENQGQVLLIVAVNEEDLDDYPPGAQLLSKRGKDEIK